MSYSNIKRLSQLLCLYLLMCLPAQAQDQIEEVIVSASFRDSTLRTAPASITVMNQQTIGQRGAQHIDELLGRAANVNITGGASRGKFVQVRGIGDIEQFKDPKHYPAVGLMIDELDMSNLGTAGTLFDIEQVEILRGPQGTRFGSAALGGMIKLKSAAPSDSFEGKVLAGISDYNGTELGAALGGPISDTLSGRLAVHQYKSDGYKDNTFLNKDDTNGFDEQVVRARLKWQASGDGEFDLNIFYLDVDNGYDAFSLNNSRFETRSDQPGRDKQNTLAASLTNRLLLKDQLLLETTLTAKDVELEYSFDEDWDNSQLCVISSCPFGGWDSFDLYLRDRQEQSLDVRLVSQHQLNNSGDWRWLLGFYHQRRTEELSRGQVNPFLSDYDIDRSAIYGQVEVQLSDNLTMTTGLRGESFEDDYQDNLPSQLDSEDSLWAGEISFNYAMNDSSQLYVTVSRGYKAGGINTDANADYSLLSDLFQDHIGSRLGFDQETLVNWELGVKSLALDGSLAINAAVFY
ncbi:TonB-dependent receptor, partial [Halieaceae bacterium]|nr:TonB-dependent receptor [Halieaceae bacterium]